MLNGMMGMPQNLNRYILLRDKCSPREVIDMVTLCDGMIQVKLRKTSVLRL